ncbi:MAG: pyridoxal phosphate-dependent decarboxylase family protein [Pirellulaceae bacterium]
MTSESWRSSIAALAKAMEALQVSRSLPEGLPGPDVPEDREAIDGVLGEVVERLKGELPYGDACYAGQMLKPPAVIAQLAYQLAMTINPNNHALDGGLASSQMEKEAIVELSAMVGWHASQESRTLGHLTGGGTMANLEALWVAGKERPGKTILASSQAHYTHQRIASVLQLPCELVPVDGLGRIDLIALQERLRRGDVGTVVATMGTTGLGAVDPLDKIADWKQQFGFRLHVDAAYGGYFKLIEEELPQATRKAFHAMALADSVVIDPHKHGLQPYGCGSVLFQDARVGQYYQHDSPYTYFSSDALHLGEISLECSRPGAAAVALWATLKQFPLQPGGLMAERLGQCRRAAVELHQRLAASSDWWAPWSPMLDIVVWAPKEKSISESSLRSRRVFIESARRGLHVALLEVPKGILEQLACPMEIDQDRLTCLRSVLMKPTHLAAVPWIDATLQQASQATNP